MQIKINTHSDCTSMAVSAANRHTESNVQAMVEVFYSNITDLEMNYDKVLGFISGEEKARAQKFHFEEDRKTFIFSHAYMRFILASRLKISPEKIHFGRDEFNKPVLEGLQYNFNITHTKNAFAIAVSQDCNVGIDMENISRKTDLLSVVRTYFSIGDQRYIEDSEGNPTDRFFLLWTRKEALLKAIGVGITTDLTRYEVRNGKFETKDKMQNDIDYYTSCYNHHIYTKKTGEGFMSIASPCRAHINLNQLTSESFKSWE